MVSQRQHMASSERAYQHTITSESVASDEGFGLPPTGEVLDSITTYNVAYCTFVRRV